LDALLTSYIAPSLTPTSGHPSFRVYSVDPETFAVLDYTTYIANTSSPSFHSPSGPEWTEYYSAKAVYEPLVTEVAGSEAASSEDHTVELSASFWHNVTVALEKSPDAFSAYLTRKTRGWRDAPECDANCTAAEICRLRAARSEDNCWVPTPGPPGLGGGRRGKKWDAMAHEEHGHDECGDLTMQKSLASLIHRRDLLQLLVQTLVDGDRSKIVVGDL
jgi:sphingomyelin phosphodiesterase